MKCIKCGSELVEGAKFCSKCGSKVESNVIFCSNCGTKLESNAKFCYNCGTPLENIGANLKADEVTDDHDLPDTSANKGGQGENKEVDDGFILVDAGSFMFGKKEDYEGQYVSVDGFYMCDHPVTLEEWQDVMETIPDGYSKHTIFHDNIMEKKCPVVLVDWYDAVEYCNALSKLNGLTPCYDINKKKIDLDNKSDIDEKKWTVTFDGNANGYRLPYFAEWEFAARGGNKSYGYKYSGSDDFYEVGLRNRSFGYKDSRIKQKKPNELGLYDMSGGVLEWCYNMNSSREGRILASGEEDVTSWKWQSPGAYEAYEEASEYDGGGINWLGFRVVRSALQNKYKPVTRNTKPTEEILERLLPKESAESQNPAADKEEASNRVIFVNISDDGLFGTCGYWENGKVVELPHKKYEDPSASIEQALKDAKTEAEKVFGKRVDVAVVGVPDICSYEDICSYKRALSNAGLRGRFLRTTIAQSLAIAKNAYEKDEEFTFGIYNYVGNNLIGAVFETGDGVDEVKYVEFNDSDTLRGSGTSSIKTFCKKSSNRFDSWNYANMGDPKDSSDDEYKRTLECLDTIFLNENCSDWETYLKNEDGKDKNYSIIKTGELTNTGLAIQSGMLDGSLRDMLLLDTTLFSVSVKINGGDFIDSDNENQRLLNRQKTIPTKVTSEFKIKKNSQPTLTLDIVIDKSDDSKDKTVIPIEWEGITPDSVCRFKVTIDMFANANLEANITMEICNKEYCFDLKL